jgi:hypothetical protein
MSPGIILDQGRWQVRTVKRTVVMLAAVAALAAAGRADEPSFSGKEPKWPEMEMLLKDRQVAKEIKLTGPQELAARRALFEPLGKFTQALNKLQDLKLEEFQAKSREARLVYNEEEREVVGKVLKPAQFKRIKQIQVQGAGLDAFLQPAVQKELKLSAEQKDKVKDAAREFRKAGEDIEKGTDLAAALREETMKSLVALLTEEQQKTWKEMTGEPFQLDDGR